MGVVDTQISIYNRLKKTMPELSENDILNALILSRIKAPLGPASKEEEYAHYKPLLDNSNKTLEDVIWEIIFIEYLETRTNELLKKKIPPEAITTWISEVRQYIKERTSKIKPRKRKEKINSPVLTEENKISITEEVFGQESRAKKNSDDDEAYKKMSYSIGTAQQKEAKEWFKKAYSTDNLTLKIEYYTKAIELDPKYAYAYFYRGGAYNNLGEYQKAIADCTKIIELNPKDTHAYNNRGIAYNKLAEYQKAIDDYTKAIELDPKDAYVYYYRGGAYAHQGLPTVACSDYYQAGILFLKQNNTPQSLKCVDFMKKADPSSPFINKLMDQINK